MICLVIVLYGVSVVLAVWGLIRVLSATVKAKKALPEPAPSGEPSYGQVQAVVTGAVKGVTRGPMSAAIDLTLVGGSVIVGAIASVISLFI